MSGVALQVIDDFLFQYNVGQAIFLLVALSVLGALPLKSRRVYAVQFTAFGLLYMLTPQSLLEATYWKFLGLAMLVVAPVLYVTAGE